MTIYTLHLTTAEGEPVEREIKADTPEQALQRMTLKFPGCSQLRIVDTRLQSDAELREEEALREAPLPTPAVLPGKPLARARLGLIALVGGLLALVASALFSSPGAGGCLLCWIAIAVGASLLVLNRIRPADSAENRGPKARKQASDEAKNRRR